MADELAKYAYVDKDTGRIEVLTGDNDDRPATDYDRYPIGEAALQEVESFGPFDDLNKRFTIENGEFVKRAGTVFARSDGLGEVLVTTVEEARAAADRIIMIEIEWVVARFSASTGYMSFEQGTFEQQLAEALAYKADPSAATPWLSSILEDGETVEQLADKVLANHEGLRNKVAPLMKLKRNSRAKVRAMTTVEEVHQYVQAVQAGLAKSQ